MDEVLAVGDAAFQEKCLRTMERSAGSGKTILFVSHNMASIQHLCSRAILLKSGQLSMDGQPQAVVKSYLSELLVTKESGVVSIRDWPDRFTNGQARIVHFEIADGNGQVTNSIPVGGSVRFSIFAEFYEPLVDPCFGVLVNDAAGDPMLDIRSSHDGLRIGRVNGELVVHASVEQLGLYPGNYLLSPWITDSASCTDCLDWVKYCCNLRIDPAPGPHGDLRLNSVYGKYWVPSTWVIR